jgi:DNA topoisomerase-1
MAHALFDTVAVDMLAGPDGGQRHMLRANGSTLIKPGYIAVYQEGRDDSSDDDSDQVLPAMQIGDEVELLSIKGRQHFTEPPPRYTEASLVKALEEYGIGRPSTYASIISTLRDREYVEIESRRFTATDIGKIVCRFLTDHFHKYVEYGFTADMEDELDAVARGEEPWTVPLSKFWKPFIHLVELIEKTVTREQVAQARELGRHPESGKPMTVRMGQYGPFVQIGTKDDAEKPKFAGLRPGQKMDQITLEQALELFKLPRTLGSNAEGEPIVANIGRFGPYIKYGSKYVSLKDDPYTVTLETALECIRIKKEADANRIIQDFGVDNIQVLNGRYGPYISNKEKNARIPKGREPKSITLEEARALLEAAPVRPMRGRGRFGAKKKTAAATAANVATAATTATGVAAPKSNGAQASAGKKPARKKAGAARGTSAAATPAAAVPAAPVAAATAPKAAAKPAARTTQKSQAKKAAPRASASAARKVVAKSAARDSTKAVKHAKARGAA